MEIKTISTAREKDVKYDVVRMTFRKNIPVSREVLSYTLLSLVAEVVHCFSKATLQPELTTFPCTGGGIPWTYCRCLPLLSNRDEGDCCPPCMGV